MSRKILKRFHKGWFIATVTNTNLVAIAKTEFDADCKARQLVSGISVPWPPRPPLRAA